MPKVVPLNCSKCGRFVGKDGFYDVMYDHYNGWYEVGYPLCKKCLDRSNTKNTEQQIRSDSKYPKA